MHLKNKSQLSDMLTFDNYLKNSYTTAALTFQL